jgi:hypothetical protein
MATTGFLVFGTSARARRGLGLCSSHHYRQGIQTKRILRANLWAGQPKTRGFGLLTPWLLLLTTRQSATRRFALLGLIRQ